MPVLDETINGCFVVGSTISFLQIKYVKQETEWVDNYDQ
jgi:hypothetical protein